MDGEFSPQWRPEPEPSNALERLMQKATTEPAMHGCMLHALWLWPVMEETERS